MTFLFYVPRFLLSVKSALKSWILWVSDGVRVVVPEGSTVLLCLILSEWKSLRLTSQAWWTCRRRRRRTCRLGRRRSSWRFVWPRSWWPAGALSPPSCSWRQMSTTFSGYFYRKTEITLSPSQEYQFEKYFLTCSSYSPELTDTALWGGISN